MESFAFWYSEKEGSKGTVDAIVHFNLWCACGWDKAKPSAPESASPFLDIGFQVKHLSCADKLSFFLPFSIPGDKKETYIEDLGCKFNSNPDLAAALFNENCSVTNTPGSKRITVNGIPDSDPFYIYQLDVMRDIQLEDFKSGTILTISTGQISPPDGGKPDDPTYYFRFRIKQRPLDSLIHEYASPGGAFQSLFNTTYMVDFRFHNIRSLDKSLIERFHKSPNRMVQVSQLHFFLMTKAYVDVSAAHFKSTRMIEQNVWKSYVNDHDTTDLVAYHYADKPSGDDPFLSSSELFTKFRVERSVLPKYVLITIALGALGSLLASLFTWILHG